MNQRDTSSAAPANPSVHFRLAEPRDLEDILSLGAWQSRDEDWIYGGFQRCLASPFSCACVAIDRNTIVRT